MGLLIVFLSATVHHADLHRSPPPGRCCGTDRCCQHPTVQAQDHFGPRVVQPSSLEIWNSYYRRWRRCASGKLHGCPVLWSYHHRNPSPGIQSSVRHRLLLIRGERNYFRYPIRVWISFRHCQRRHRYRRYSRCQGPTLCWSPQRARYCLRRCQVRRNLRIGFPYHRRQRHSASFPDFFQDKQVKENLFSFYLNRDASAAVGGELNFGGIDTEHFSGNLTYHQVVWETYWTLYIDSVKYNGADTETCKGNCKAAIDSGTSLIAGPTAAATKLNTLIGATHIYGPEYIVDCGKISTLGDVTFTINGKAYPLGGKDYVLQETEMGETICMSGVMGMDIQDGMWILGDIFMGRCYTVFDFENKQVGFAPAK